MSVSNNACLHASKLTSEVVLTILAFIQGNADLELVRYGAYQREKSTRSHTLGHRLLVKFSIRVRATAAPRGSASFISQFENPIAKLVSARVNSNEQPAARCCIL